MRFKIQFSLTLYTPPAPCRKGEGRLGQGVHKVLESQSSVCQDGKYGEDEKSFLIEPLVTDRKGQLPAMNGDE